MGRMGRGGEEGGGRKVGGGGGGRGERGERDREKGGKGMLLEENLSNQGEGGEWAIQRQPGKLPAARM